MKVSIEKRLPLSEAITAYKQAELEESGDQHVLLFRDAEIRLVEFYPDELNPVALYAKKENLDFQRKLRKHLLRKYGVDTLALTEVLHLRTEKGLVGMIPPYTELSEEDLSLIAREGDRPPQERQTLRLQLLIDGLHRGLIAREEGVSITCLSVRNIPRSHPYPAYPCGWEQVVVGDEVPPLKKYYRLQDKYTFMRPLDALRLLPKTETEYGRK